MVEVRQLTLRGQNQKAARERAAPKNRGVVRVEPRDDDVRKYIKHLPSGRGFPENGPALWPNNIFTQRRIQDGSVRVVQEEQQETQQRPQRGYQRQPRSDQSGT